MNNEYNEINYSNSFENKIKEYPKYNEYNRSTFQTNNETKELVSYKEIGKEADEKIYEEQQKLVDLAREASSDVASVTSTEAAATTEAAASTAATTTTAAAATTTAATATTAAASTVSMSAVITKLVTSFVIVSAAVSFKGNILLGPKTKIKDIFVEHYESSLFISIMFSEFDAEDELELIVKNDFYNQTLLIEPHEEYMSEDEKTFYYNAELENLKQNTSYLVQVVSGINILYSKTITIDYEEVVESSIVSSFDVQYIDNAIMYSINFENYILNDIIKVEIAKESEVLYEEYVNDVVSLYYANSHQMTEPGEYLVSLYINDHLSDSARVDILEPPTALSNISLSENESLISYQVSFDYFNENDDVSLVISFDGNELFNQPITTVSELSYSGSFSATESGTYTFMVFVNDELADSDFIEVTVAPKEESEIDDFYLASDGPVIYYRAYFTKYVEDDLIQITIEYNDTILYTDTLTNISLEDGYEGTYEPQEFGTYTFKLYINSRLIDTQTIENEDMSQTEESIVSELELAQDGEVVYYRVYFDKYVSDDTILVKVTLDEKVVMEDTLQNVSEEDGYEGEFEPSESGIYTFDVYVNSNLVKTDTIEVESQTPPETSVITEFELAQDGGTIYYRVYFEKYIEDDTLEVKIVHGDTVLLTDQLVVTSTEDGYEGTYEPSESGMYTFNLYQNSELIKTDSIEVSVAPPATSTITSFEVAPDGDVIYYRIYFETYEEDEIYVQILIDDVLVYTDNVSNVNVEDGFEGEYTLDRNGNYTFALYQNGSLVESEDVLIEDMFVESTINAASIYIYDTYLYYQVDFETYDSNESFEISLTSTGLDTTLPVTIVTYDNHTIGYAVYDNANAELEYEFALSTTAGAYARSDTFTAKTPLDIAATDVVVNTTSTFTVPDIYGNLTSTDYTITVQIIGSAYNVTTDITSDTQGGNFRVLVNDLEEADYIFLMYASDGTQTDLIYYTPFTVQY